MGHIKFVKIVYQKATFGKCNSLNKYELIWGFKIFKRKPVSLWKSDEIKENLPSTSDNQKVEEARLIIKNTCLCQMIMLSILMILLNKLGTWASKYFN